MKKFPTQVYFIIESRDYEGCEIPEKCFLKYEDAVIAIKELAKQMRLKINKYNVIQFGGGRIEICSIPLV